jgi:hypothetical protein
LAEVWQIGPGANLEEGAFAQRVEARFRQIYQRHFATGEWVNHALPIQVRALRDMAPWRVFLLLTPWMMARLFLPRTDPGLPLAHGWRAADREGADYLVIGPPQRVQVFGEHQPAHLNHDQELGHYLIQPLVQAMEAYADADAVFQAWNEVLATRQRVMDETKRECIWQRELSRREFLARLRGA